MDKAMTELKAALLNQFKGSVVELRYFRPGRSFGGSIVWPGFEGMDQLDRQRALRKVVNATLDEEGRSRASLIITMIPEEAAALTEQHTF